MIPLCDLYVASISATIRSAIACGIPVINYDTFRYRYGDYLKADTVVHVEDAISFKDVLTRFCDDHAFSAEFVAKQQRVMRHWGLVDHAFPDRLAQLAQQAMGRAVRNSATSDHAREGIAVAAE